MSPASGGTTVLFTRTDITLNATAQPPGIMSTDLSVAKYCVYGPIFLFSVSGNTLVILAVVLLRKMKTVPMIFIANLAACDLITTLSSIPFDLPAEELGHWPYGQVLCRILWPLATVSTNSAALTLVAISSDRYISIIYPLNFSCRITKGRCFKIIAAIHCVSVIAVVPYVAILRFSDGEAASCDENWPNEYSGKVYTVVLFVLQYGLPLLVMSVIYTRIGLKLFKNTRKAIELSSPKTERARRPSGPEHSDNTINSALLKRKQQNDKTAKMFLFVVVIFLVFMMPHQMLWLSYDYFADTEEFKANSELIAFVCRAFTYTNSVLNAIIYGVCNGNFRRAVLLVLKCQCTKARQRNQERKLRGDTMNPTFSRLRQDSFVSTLTSSENGLRGNHNTNTSRKEAISKNAFANGIERETPPILDNINERMARSRLENAKHKLDDSGMSHENSTTGLNICNGNVPLDKDSQPKHFSTESVYDQASPENDTSFLLLQTENLVNKLRNELGTGDSLYQQRNDAIRETAERQMQSVCEVKETIL